MAENNASKITMTHPRLPGRDPASTTREAFNKIWAPKGWVERKPTSTPARPSPAPVSPPATSPASPASNHAKPGDSGSKEN